LKEKISQKILMSRNFRCACERNSYDNVEFMLQCIACKL
jgi:hypothetical protein